MINYILSGFIALALSVGGWFGVSEYTKSKPNFGAFSDPFISIQLATSPSNGECLKTDGTNNDWDSCGGGSSAFPFTPTSWGNSTSTTLGFLNGFLSTASSTINAPLRLTGITGALYGGTGGLVGATATTTVTCSGDATCTPFVVFGSSPIDISATAGAGAVDGTGFAGMIPYWVDGNTLGATSTGVFAQIHATSTTATSTFGHGISVKQILSTATSSLAGLRITSGGLSIDTLTAGLLKSSSNNIIAAVAGTDYEVPVTAGDCLTRTVNDLDVDDCFILNTGDVGTGSYTFPNASSTNFSSEYASSTRAHFGTLTVGLLTSAITLTGTDGLFAEYTGTSCTNQFVRSLSALGVATCATVIATDVDLADLTATNGTLTFSGTYDGQTARTIGLNLGNANSWTALQQFTANASTTLLSSNGTMLFNFLRIPTSTDPVVNTSGDIAINTTAASSSIRFYNGTEETALYPMYVKTPIFATSTLGGKILKGGATSTIEAMTYVPQHMRQDKVVCRSFGADFQLQIGTSAPPTNATTLIIRQSTTTFTTFTHSLYKAGESIYYYTNATSTSWDRTPCTILFKTIGE